MGKGSSSGTIAGVALQGGGVIATRHALTVMSAREGGRGGAQSVRGRRSIGESLEGLKGTETMIIADTERR